VSAGVYQDATPVLVGTAGTLAKIDPNGPSPIIPGFTNLQTALFFGAATWAVGGLECCYHFVGGVFNEFGIPTDLTFTPVDGWLDFMLIGASYAPYLWHAEQEAITCDETDLPYDDHLGDITVPVLYVGAAGGYAEDGLHTLGLLGSTDVTSTIVQLYPPEAVAVDIGHVDIWTSNDSPTLFWTPILDWVDAHVPVGSGNTRLKPKVN
jgi:hypothetical protein